MEKISRLAVPQNGQANGNRKQSVIDGLMSKKFKNAEDAEGGTACLWHFCILDGCIVLICGAACAQDCCDCGCTCCYG